MRINNRIKEAKSIFSLLFVKKKTEEVVVEMISTTLLIQINHYNFKFSSIACFHKKMEIKFSIPYGKNNKNNKI